MAGYIARRRGMTALALGAAVVAISGVPSPAAALTIVPIFDSSVTQQAAAGSIEAAFKAVAADYDRSFSNQATVYVDVGWGEVGGTALPSNAVGASEANLYGYYSFSTIRSALAKAAASNAADQTLVEALAHLPATGASNFVVTSADAKALGLIAATGTAVDGYIGFAGRTTGYGFTPATVAANQYDFQSVAAHELSEVLGRISGVDEGAWRTPLDLYRYSAPGVLSFSYGAKTYFSVDGGKTALLAFNSASTGDRGDWATTSTTNDAFDAFISHGQHKSISAVDLAVLDVLGWSGANAGNSGGTPGGTSISLTASVPEPASWGMMVVGFGLVGAAVRRRAAAVA